MVFDAVVNAIAYFGYAHPLIFFGIIAILSLVILLKSSELVLFGISDYARKFGISEYVIGILVISAGTALSELMAAITGTLRGEGGIAFGTVLGSSLFKIPGLGIVLLVTGAVIFNLKDMRGKTAFLPLAMILLPAVLIANGYLSRIDGSILLISYLAYTAVIWSKGGRFGKLRPAPLKLVWRDMIIFPVALAAVLMSARWLVFSSLQISTMLGVPAFITGLFIIGIGSSMPEISVQFRAMREKKPGLVFGNVLGSFVANSTLVLGIAALIRPVKMPFFEVLSAFVFLFAGAFGVIMLLRGKRLSRLHGLAFVLFYALFLLAQFLF